MWWVHAAAADALPPLPRADEVPEVRWYGRVDEVGGRLEGRYRRRRDGEHALTVLPDGLVVRWWQATRGGAIDHQRDAAGRPLVTVTWTAGVPAAVTLHGPVDEQLPVEGWSWAALPGGGAVWAQAGAAAGEAPGGPLLGGTWSAAVHPATDPFAPAFAEGLLDGCACALFDRGTTWVDGRTAARHALLVPAAGALPGSGGEDLAEVWAIPRDGALLVLTYRVHAPADPVAASRAARALPALVDLDAVPAGGAP